MSKVDKKENDAISALSSREKYNRRYRERFPDMNMDDEEIFYSQANADLDDLESYKKHSEELVGAFNNNRALAAMLMAAKEGQDPWEWLAENMGADISRLLEDSEYLHKITEATKRYHKAQLEGEESRKESEKNLTESLETLKRIGKEKGLDDEQCLNVFSYIYEDIFANGLKGIVTEATFRMVIDGLNYSHDIADARREGEVIGRNAKISEQLRKEKGDGTVPPALGGTATIQSEAPKRKYKPFLIK